jgi:hypothetical protein
MARPSEKLINALKITASNLENGNKYMWGHMGACNCGNLAQSLTSYTKAEIHEFAMQGKGDWSEQVAAYCSGTKLPMEFIISDLLKEGLTIEDLIDLERLSNKKVLNLIPHSRRITMKHNVMQDVVLYLNTWADLLEKEIHFNKTASLKTAEKNLMKLVSVA